MDRRPTSIYLADGGEPPVSIDDWETLVANLRRFGRRGTVEATEDEVRIDVGSARFAVTRDGRVESGMPLHGFEADGIETLGFDHEEGRIVVRGEDVSYEFRRP